MNYSDGESFPPTCARQALKPANPWSSQSGNSGRLPEPPTWPLPMSLTNSRTLSARSPWLQGSKCLVTGGVGEGTTLHKKPRPTIPSTFQILLHGSLGVAPSPLHTPRAGRKWHAFLITKGSFSCKLSNSGSLGQVPTNHRKHKGRAPPNSSLGFCSSNTSGARKAKV